MAFHRLMSVPSEGLGNLCMTPKTYEIIYLCNFCVLKTLTYAQMLQEKTVGRMYSVYLILLYKEDGGSPDPCLCNYQICFSVFESTVHLNLPLEF